jgi:hypothetical protein
MARGREIYIFGKGERVCTSLKCVAIERKRASTLRKKRKNFNAK